MSKFKILLVGCGQLGSRYLQAISSLRNVSEVCIVDNKLGSIELGKQRLKEVPDANQEIKYSWLKSLNGVFSDGNLCVISTQAKERPILLKEIAKTKNYRNFLIEKIVSQSVKEYEELLEFSNSHNLSVWVDCQYRSYEINKYIKSLLKPNEPIILSNLGGNQDLACMGIHYADLFVFLDGANEIKDSGAFIDQILHPSKRGKDIYGLSGTLIGYSEKGSKLIISYAQYNMGTDFLYIMTPTHKFAMDQNCNLTAFESSIDSNWTWKKIPMKEEYYVSKMSRKFISDILNNGNCELPSLLDCYPAHKYILNTLLPHFNKLLGENNNYCPVT